MNRDVSHRIRKSLLSVSITVLSLNLIFSGCTPAGNDDSSDRGTPAEVSLVGTAGNLSSSWGGGGAGI
jgi:hypothetical protein